MAQPSQPPLNDRIADIILKVVKTGGLPAGGLTGLWLLLSDGGVLKAIASMGIGLGVSYGAKLLQPLHEGTGERLERAGEAMNARVEEVTNQLITRATKFEDKYGLCQAADCQSLRPEGVAQYDGIFIPLLRDVFVPLSLDINGTSPGFQQLQQSLRRGDMLPPQGQTIWTLLQKIQATPNLRQLAILAWGGYGKTTLLKHIAYRYGTQQQPKSAPKLLPALLVLRKYRDVIAQENPPDLPTLITQHHIPSLPQSADLKPPQNWATSALKRGRMIIMLDGFDEVPINQRPAIAQWINQQVRQYGKSVFILTSRPKAYRAKDANARPQLPASFWVDPFNAEQRQSFVEKWYRCQERFAHMRDGPDVDKIAVERAQNLLDQIEARDELRDLARNPLLLNMITTFHRRYPGAEIPQRRVELYREICQLQLTDRPRDRALQTVLIDCNAQAVLQQLAYGMMTKRWKRIPRPTLLSGLTKMLARQEESVDAAEFLKQVVEVSELLVQQEDEYEFAHLSFQEYLASAYIAQERKRESLLHKRLEDDWWKPTILLYVSQVNPTRLIQEMLRRGLNDLAYDSWQETTKRVDSALESELVGLKQQVKDSRYARLEEYLKNGQWKEADKETERLMLAAVGKEEGQYLYEEDLRNFPCEDLLAIDDLWVRHSKGRFGFSVQKEIYTSKDVGGVADGKYDEKSYGRFQKQVGWSNYQVTYDTSSPRGHLPGRAGLFCGGFLGIVVFSSLAFTFVKCKAQSV